MSRNFAQVTSLFGSYLRDAVNVKFADVVFPALLVYSTYMHCSLEFGLPSTFLVFFMSCRKSLLFLRYFFPIYYSIHIDCWYRYGYSRFCMPRNDSIHIPTGTGMIILFDWWPPLLFLVRNLLILYTESLQRSCCYWSTVRVLIGYLSGQ
jgi:hypothetical protein